MTDPLPAYPKRLIEVDLPIARISAHARREKSIHHGHIRRCTLVVAQRHPCGLPKRSSVRRSGPIRRTRSVRTPSELRREGS